MQDRYAAPTAPLLWHRWEGEEQMVVFDAASGSTHLLSAAAAEVLLALLSGPGSRDATGLAQALLAEDGAPPLPQDVQALQGVLEQLARLGLVRSCDDTAL